MTGANLSDEVLLGDLAAVAKLLGDSSPTTKQYNEYGKFHSATVRNRFKTWNAALEKAGLSPVRNNGGVRHDEALADLRRVAEELQLPSLSQAEYEACGKFSSKPFSRLFGSWNAALTAAGLTATRRYRIPDEELFQNLERMWRTLGRQPAYSEVEKPFSEFTLVPMRVGTEAGERPLRRLWLSSMPRSQQSRLGGRKSQNQLRPRGSSDKLDVARHRE